MATTLTPLRTLRSRDPAQAGVNALSRPGSQPNQAQGINEGGKMASDHFQPGEPALWAGTYYLVDRHGTLTECYVWREADEPLPLAGVNGYGALYYRYVGYDASQDAA